MNEINVIVYGIVLMFIVSITVMIGTTTLQVVMPEMSNVANQSSFVDYNDYTEKQDVIWIFSKIALFVCLAIPFVYIAIRLLYKKEPVAYADGY